MRKITKLRRNIKAISPIISVLLMIAIAVVASLVVYAWVMGYISYQTGKTGDAVQIQSVTFAPAGTGTEQVQYVYLQDVGSTSITMIPAQCLYVNGQLDTKLTTLSLTALMPGNTTQITASTYNAGSNPVPVFVSGQTVTIKVTTQGGTYSQVTQQAP